MSSTDQAMTCWEVPDLAGEERDRQRLAVRLRSAVGCLTQLRVIKNPTDRIDHGCRSSSQSTADLAASPSPDKEQR